MQNENTAGRKGISLILLIGGIALLASALVLDFMGSEMAFRGAMLILGALAVMAGCYFFQIGRAHV